MFSFLGMIVVHVEVTTECNCGQEKPQSMGNECTLECSICDDSIEIRE